MGFKRTKVWTHQSSSRFERKSDLDLLLEDSLDTATFLLLHDTVRKLDAIRANESVDAPIFGPFRAKESVLDMHT
jgi:hypothetical protein